MSEEELKRKFIAEFRAKVAAHMKVMREARAAEFAARKKENRKLFVALAALKSLVGSSISSQMQIPSALSAKGRYAATGPGAEADSSEPEEVEERQTTPRR